MDGIIERFNEMIRKTTVTKKRVEVLHDFSEQLSDECEYREEITRIINALKDGAIDEALIDDMKNIVGKINEPTDEQVNHEIIGTQLDVDNIEKELDSHVTKYCGFSEKKPMEYVGYDINQQTYAPIRHGRRTDRVDLRQCRGQCRAKSSRRHQSWQQARR